MDQFTPDKICFGLSLDLDRESLACYLTLLGNPEFARTLANRMSSEEIDTLVSQVTRLLKSHLSESEYHSLFLQQEKQH